MKSKQELKDLITRQKLRCERLSTALYQARCRITRFQSVGVIQQVEKAVLLYNHACCKLNHYNQLMGKL